MHRDIRTATIGGGTTHAPRTQIAGNLGIKTPQTRDGCTKIAQQLPHARVAA